MQAAAKFGAVFAPQPLQLLGQAIPVDVVAPASQGLGLVKHPSVEVIVLGSYELRTPFFNLLIYESLSGLV